MSSAVQTVKKTDGRTKKLWEGGRSARSVLPRNQEHSSVSHVAKDEVHAIGQLLVNVDTERRQRLELQPALLSDTRKTPPQRQGKRPLGPRIAAPSFAVFYEATTEGQQSDDGHFSSPQHKSVNYPASLVDLGYGLGMVH